MTLVLCLGNPLREDDGIGRAVAEALARDGVPDDVALHWQVQLTPELAIDVAAADHVIVVDASASSAPDAIEVATLDPASATQPLTHEISPPALLALAGALYGRMPTAVIVTLGVRHLGLREGLSHEAASRVDALVRTVRHQMPSGLRRQGLTSNL